MCTCITNTISSTFVSSELTLMRERLCELQKLTKSAADAAERGERMPEGLARRLEELIENEVSGLDMNDDDDNDPNVVA